MKRLASALLASFALLAVSRAAESSSPATTAPARHTLAQLAFLTGLWRGTSSSGATAEELISSPDGGVMLCAGREFKGDRCIFFDLVAFVEKDDAITLIPHPNGRRSAHTFPLVTLDAAAKRAVFENQAHDFPKVFTYEFTAPGCLSITLTGEQKGQPAKETYDFVLVK